MARKSRAERLGEFLESDGGWAVFGYETTAVSCIKCGRRCLDSAYCGGCGTKLDREGAMKKARYEAIELLEQAIKYALGEDGK